MSRLEESKEEAKKILNGLEDGSITVGQAALICLKIARLMNDEEALLWLRHEISGYPKNMTREIFKIAWEKSRGYYSDSKQKVFSETADEIESLIPTYQEAIKSYSTAGVSVGGDYTYRTMENLTSTVTRATRQLLDNIRINQKRLAILRRNYYDYALSIYNELQFAGQVEDLFHRYREEVDTKLSASIPESLRRLQTAYESLSSKEPESWSQGVLTCRRLMKGLADELFKHPVDQTFTTKSETKLDVSGDNYKNKLFALIDEFGESSTKVRLTVANVEYIVSYVDNLIELINKGIHEDDPISYEEARMAIIHTYILLGDILLCCNLPIYGDNDKE